MIAISLDTKWFEPKKAPGSGFSLVPTGAISSPCTVTTVPSKCTMSSNLHPSHIDLCMKHLSLLRQEVQPVLIIRKMALSEYQQLSTEGILIQAKAASIQQCTIIYMLSLLDFVGPKCPIKLQAPCPAEVLQS